MVSMETKTEFDKSAIRTQQKLFSSINFSIIFKIKFIVKCYYNKSLVSKKWLKIIVLELYNKCIVLELYNKCIVLELYNKCIPGSTKCTSIVQ
jgi:hypothetical protein